MTIRFPIVKPVLPDISQYQHYIESTFGRCWLTNNGPLLKELEARLSDYLGVNDIMLVANGTLALQVAYKALELKGNVATSPFSFAATSSSLAWHGDTPYFVDINADSLNVDEQQLEATFSQNDTSLDGFVGVHVFGNAGDVERMGAIAEQYNKPFVYDAAHAFGVKFKGRSLLSYGDASTLSFHATKLFHCVEGGGIVFKEKHHMDLARELINFGFDSTMEPANVGINAKMSEMHAAMGLCLLDKIDDIISHRVELVHLYRELLDGVVSFQHWSSDCSQNGAYMPVLFESEEQLLGSMSYLAKQGVQTRRYFYPSLSQVETYGRRGETPIANSASKRVLCLPMFFDLGKSDVALICEFVKQSISVKA